MIHISVGIQLIIRISMDVCSSKDFIDISTIKNKVLIHFLKSIKHNLPRVVKVKSSEYKSDSISYYSEQLIRLNILEYSELSEKKPVFIKAKDKIRSLDTFYVFYKSKLPISWGTIKNLTKDKMDMYFPEFYQSVLNYNSQLDPIEFIQVIFWFYRKGIVDNILSLTIPPPGKNICKRISPGSVRLTSDYDLTIDGKCALTVYNNFNNYMKFLYSELGSIVFDTNIYYVSFLTTIRPLYLKSVFYTEHKPCINNNEYDSIYTYNIDKENARLQHVWAVLKVYKSVNDIINLETPDEKVYHLEDLLTTLDNNKLTGIDIMNLIDNSVKLNTITQTDFINNLSLVNYKNPETYYTRGAFLDIVLNQQMCKNEKGYNLSKHDYIDSFLENVADYLSHFNSGEKYKKRLIDASKRVDDRLYSVVQHIFSSECCYYKIMDVFFYTSLMFVSVEDINEVNELVSKHESHVVPRQSWVEWG